MSGSDLILKARGGGFIGERESYYTSLALSFPLVGVRLYEDRIVLKVLFVWPITLRFGDIDRLSPAANWSLGEDFNGRYVPML